jgi:uncharacterized membrane protein YdjX (TVP38/TMEM64 family)
MGRFASRHLVTVTAVGMVVLVVALAAATPTGRHIVDATASGDSRELRRSLRALGFGGVLVLLAVILSHAIVPFPIELVSGAAGFVYGFWLALPMLLLFLLLSALLAYWLAERFGRPLARRLIGQERLARAERLVDRGGAGALLSMRVIPLIPYNAVCYAAGITRVPLVRYSWTTVVGILPLTIFVTYLGSRLRSPDFADPRIWLLVLVIVGTVIAGSRFRRGGLG